MITQSVNYRIDLFDLVPIKSDISSKMSGSSTKGEVR
jgi:hypothetical protein